MAKLLIGYVSCYEQRLMGESMSGQYVELRCPLRQIVIAALAAFGCSMSVSAATSDCMNADSPSWHTTESQRALYRQLVEYMSCPSDDPASGKLADRVACNYFVGKVLNDVYNIDDFSTGTGSWLLANEIHRYVSRNTKAWSRLGAANVQSVLNDASAGAANGHAVIAITPGVPGHVALILPGLPKASSSWGGLKVPNSAAFSLDNVDKAYVFCRLSYAFSDPRKVEIFWRVKN